MARYGPPDEFNRQPTQQADFGAGGYHPYHPPPPQSPDVQPTDVYGPVETQDLETEPRPWYRRPVMLIGWGVLVVILIALIIYGVMALIGDHQGTSPAPSSTTTTAPSTTTTEPSTTTTTPATTTPATTSEETTPPPPTSGPVGPAPPQPTRQPPRPQPTPQPTQQPTHHHLPPLPSVITIPGGPPITLPPGLTH